MEEASVTKTGDGTLLIKIPSKKGILTIKPKGIGKIHEENVISAVWRGEKQNFKETDEGLKVELPTGDLFITEEPLLKANFKPL